MKDDETAPAKSQVDKFRDLARDLEVDEDEGRFKANLVKVARVTKTPVNNDGQPDDKDAD